MASSVGASNERQEDAGGIRVLHISWTIQWMTNRHSNTRSVRRSESPYVCRIANIDDSIGYRSNKEVCWECYLYICLSEVFDDNVILLSMHEYETFIHDGRHQSPVTRHKKEMTIASCIFLLFLFCFKLLRLWPHHARTKSFCLSFASRAPLITVFHWSIPTRLLCTPYSNAVLGLLYMYWGLGYLVPVLLQIPITRYDSLDIFVAEMNGWRLELFAANFLFIV